MRLELQQPGMQRRRENTTRYLSYQRRMQWRIEWRFPAAGDLSVSDVRWVGQARAPTLPFADVKPRRLHGMLSGCFQL